MKIDRYLDNLERVDESFSYSFALISFIFALVKFGFILKAIKKHTSKKPSVLSSFKNIKKSEKYTDLLYNIIQDKKISVSIYDSDDINAAALSNGQILISTGTLKECNENEIIGILLHEYGHIKNKDFKTSQKFKNGSSLAIDMFSVILSGFFPRYIIVFNIYSTIAGVLFGDFVVGKYRKIAELNADSMAKQYGYGNDLVSALQKIKNIEIELMKKELNSNDIKYINEIFQQQSRNANYPTIEERIAKILKTIDTSSANLSFKDFAKKISLKFFGGKTNETE